jgi:hypothetical protein
MNTPPLRYIYMNSDYTQWDIEPFEDTEYRIKVNEDEMDEVCELGTIPTELDNFKKRKRMYVLSLEEEVYLKGTEASFYI